MCYQKMALSHKEEHSAGNSAACSDSTGYTYLLRVDQGTSNDSCHFDSLDTEDRFGHNQLLEDQMIINLMGPKVPTTLVR